MAGTEATPHTVGYCVLQLLTLMVRMNLPMFVLLLGAVFVLAGVLIGKGCSRTETPQYDFRRVDSLQRVVDDRAKEIERLKGLLIERIDTLPRDVQDSLIDVWLR